MARANTWTSVNRSRRCVLALLCALLAFGPTGGCPTSADVDPPPPDRPRILTFENLDASAGISSITLSGSDQTPVAGDIVVGTRGGGVLRRVDTVATNADGSQSVRVVPVTIAEAAHDGDFTFADGLSSAKRRATSKTWQVLTFNADLGRTLYNRNGLSVRTSGDFDFGVTLDLDIQVRGARIQYFKSAIEGTATFELDGDIEALARVVADTGDVSLWSGSQNLYGWIGGLPIVIQARAELVAGASAEATATASLASGIAASSFIRLGAEYRINSGWSGISNQGLSFGYDVPTWCLQGELGARVYVRPTLELMFYTVAGPNFDVEPYLEYNASAYTCGGGGQQPHGAYDWELVAGAAAHAKVRVDILDLYMIESPTLTVFDVRRTLASGHGESNIDSDGDGVPDEQDGCPNDPDKTSPGNCGCGNPEAPGCGAQEPDTPTGPSPEYAEQGVSIDTDLDWANAPRATSYDVYIGRSDPPPFAGNRASSDWPLDTLNYETTYYWKIVARNSAGSTAGPVWRFTTQAQPTQPPAAPAAPSPGDQAQGVSTDADLNWADAARATSYDVYFGTTNPQLFVGNSGSSAWSLSTLGFSTGYYWKIVARNSAGSTPGPVWRFTTQTQGPISFDIRMSMESNGPLPANWNVLQRYSGGATNLVDFDTGHSTDVAVSWFGWSVGYIDDNGWLFGTKEWVVESAAKSGWDNGDLQDPRVVLQGLGDEPVRVEVLIVHRGYPVMDITANGVFATGNANGTPGVNGDDYRALEQGYVQGNWLIWDIVPLGGTVELLFAGHPNEFEVVNAVRVSR